MFLSFRKLPLLFCAILSFTQILAQETTFKTNGPDDYRSGLHAFINAILVIDYQTQTDTTTLVIKDGIIIQTGGKIPKGAIVHDLKGMWIYPSFIDIYSNYGIAEKKVERDWERVQIENNQKGIANWNQAINADFDAYKTIETNEAKAAEYRKIGFGIVCSHRTDGIARGTGTVVMLGNEKLNKLMLKEKVAAFFSFDKGTSTQDYPSSLMGSIALLRQTYYDAEWYKKTNPTREFNAPLAALNEQQNLPQIIDAGDWKNILRAKKIADEFKLQYIIKSDNTTYQRITEIKNANVPLIVSLNFPKAIDVEDPYKAQWASLDDMKHWELAPANLAFLQKEKIPFALSAFDLEKKETFIENLQKANSYGISESELLYALTAFPAKTLNVSNLCGSLAVGKVANFFIADRNIFIPKAVIYEHWVNGKKYEVTKPLTTDIRGYYSFTKNGVNPILEKCKIEITGERKNTKGTITFADSSKNDINFSVSLDNISFVINKKESNEKYFFTGKISNTTKWSGRAQSPIGEWFDWELSRINLFIDTTKLPTKDTINLNELSKVTYPFLSYGNENIPVAENIHFRNATIWTNETEGILTNADLIISNGKIVAVGKDLHCSNCTEIDATGKHITSGIIDEHSHICINGGVNESGKAISSEVRIGDVIDSDDINMYRQLAGGVTAAQLLHGSANPIGGQSALIKFRWGYAPEQLKIKNADGFIKFALGENPKQSNWGDKSTIRYPQTRMGVEQTYYNYFTKAVEYKKSHQRTDLELEALAEILNNKRFITCHSYIQSEINMLMHVADSFRFKVNTFTHILEGYKVADKMKAHGANASTFSDWWAYKYEVIDAIPQNATILTKTGINTAINSDDAEMARRLNQEAAKSVKYGGMSEEEAWKLVTLNPAKMLHLSDKMGSIKQGKDADIVVWTGNPLSVYSTVVQTYIDGICFYDIKKDAEKRLQIVKERMLLIQKMLSEKKAGKPTTAPIRKQQNSYSCGEHEH